MLAGGATLSEGSYANPLYGTRVENIAARLTGMHIDIKNESLAAGVLRDLPLTVAESDDEDEEAHRCEYVGENGVQCRNMARPGSRFCGLHERMDGVEVSDDPDSLI